MSPIRLLPALLLIALLRPVGAAHITDKLVVGLYPGPSTEGTPLQLLSSGTPLEVLQRKGAFAEVRLADDVRGWIEATYITEEKPAKAMLLETQARLRQMGIELAGLREKQAAGEGAATPASGSPPGALEAQLRRSLVDAQARIAVLERQIADGAAAVQAQPDASQDKTRRALELLADAQGMTLRPLAGAGEDDLWGRFGSWIVALTMLVLGFIGGIAFIDYRFRRRHGGFRL